MGSDREKVQQELKRSERRRRSRYRTEGPLFVGLPQYIQSYIYECVCHAVGLAALAGTVLVDRGIVPGVEIGTVLGAGTGTVPEAGTGTVPGAGTETVPEAGTGTVPGAGTGTVTGAGTGGESHRAWHSPHLN